MHTPITYPTRSLYTTEAEELQKKLVNLADDLDSALPEADTSNRSTIQTLFCVITQKLAALDAELENIRDNYNTCKEERDELKTDNLCLKDTLGDLATAADDPHLADDLAQALADAHQDRSPHILIPLSQAEKLLALLKNILTATTDYT